MNNKLIKDISSCVLAAMLLSTGASAQAITQGDQTAITAENTSSATFNACTEKIRSVYTERYPEQVEVVNSVIDDVTSDSVFWECFEYEGKAAFRILEDTLMDALTPTVETYSFSEGMYYNMYTIPHIQQVHNNYCGVAATQMALIGSQLIPNTAQNRSSDKQWEIANTMNLNGNAATIFDITSYMNRYYHENAISKYRTKIFTESTCNKIINYLTLALQSNTVPIMLIPDTSKFEYYKGYRTSHFVVVKKVDTVTRTITVIDPFHLDGENNQWMNDAFFGMQTITYDELYSVTQNRTDICLSVCSYDTLPPNQYVY